MRHAFISYVREDSVHVDQIQLRLEGAGVRVWRDTADLWPGEDWRAKIRQAIQDDALVFIACFSRQGTERTRSYQNEELLLAIEELRLRRPEEPWLIPVRLDECDIPNLEIGAGRTLRWLQRVDLFGDKAETEYSRLTASIQRIIDRNADANAATARRTVPNNASILPASRPGLGQLGSHATLVGEAPSSGSSFPRQSLDAIIVPASRPAGNLDHAVSLARTANCPLLVLCDDDAKAADVLQLAGSHSFYNAIAVDMPAGYRHELLDLETSLFATRIPGHSREYGTAVATKRNIGLLVSRIMRWERIFFLDEDIRDVRHADLQESSAMLDSFSSVGMWITNFPDNSVVCHANRMTGGFQDVFISGSALAVDVTVTPGFFPNLYNEDWLFFYDDASKAKLATSGRNVTKLRYDPFADSRLAAAQEFGDILAEGLYALLHQRNSLADATQAYWGDFLIERRSFLKRIIEHSAVAPRNIRDAMLSSVTSALETSSAIRPEMCEEYIRLWRKDLRRWRQVMQVIPPAPSAQVALGELGLQPSTWEDPFPRLVLVPHADALDRFSGSDPPLMWGAATAAGMALTAPPATPLIPGQAAMPASATISPGLPRRD